MGGYVVDIHAVACEHVTNSVVALGFAQQADGEGWALIIQFDDSNDEDDGEEYCITNGHGVSHYGGIRHVEIDTRNACIGLTLDAAAARELNFMQSMELRLQVGADQVAPAIHEIRNRMPGLVHIVD
jgi:hypothetical protein